MTDRATNAVMVARVKTRAKLVDNALALRELHTNQQDLSAGMDCRAYVLLVDDMSKSPENMQEWMVWIESSQQQNLTEAVAVSLLEAQQLHYIRKEMRRCCIIIDILGKVGNVWKSMIEERGDEDASYHDFQEQYHYARWMTYLDVLDSRFLTSQLWLYRNEVDGNRTFLREQQGLGQTLDEIRELLLKHETMTDDEQLAEAARRRTKPHNNNNSLLLRVCSYCLRREAAIKEFKKCSRCKETVYCRKECQISDWTQQHKLVCTPVTITQPDP